MAGEAGEAIPEPKPQNSHRDRLEAERLIDNVIRLTETFPDGLEIFSVRIPDPSPGLVSVLEKTARDLREQGGYEGGTTGEDSHIGRIKQIFKASGLTKSKIAHELLVPEAYVYRWVQPREKRGTAPGYHHLEMIAAFAKRLGIPGNLLDDSMCQPMTVETLAKPQDPLGPLFPGLPVEQPPSDEPTPIMVTFTSAAIRLLKERSPDPTSLAG